MRHMETTGWCVIVGGTGENKDTSDCKGVKNTEFQNVKKYFRESELVCGTDSTPMQGTACVVS